jgi:hypothetical protein
VRDIPVWLLVLVGMVGVLALSLLVYMLLPRKPAVVKSAGLDAPAAPDEVSEKQHGVPAAPAAGATGPERRAASRPRHAAAPPNPVSEKPAQAAEWPAAAVDLEQIHGRHALRGGSAQPAPIVQHHAGNGAAPTHAALPTPMEAPRNGASPASPAAHVPEPQDAAVSSAPREPAARNGAPAEQWEPPAVPAELAPPSPETLAIWADQVGATDTPPSGLATDPAMSALGWNQEPPVALAEAAEPQASETTDILPAQDNAHPTSVPPGPDGSPPPEDYTVKGNEGSRRFHTPDSPFYIRTRADVWFRTTEDAERAGFTPWNKRR